MSPKIYNLTKVERKVLWRKHIQEGLTEEESNKRVEGVVKHLKNFVARLKTANTPPEEIDRKFKEEFYKIYEKLDK